MPPQKPFGTALFISLLILLLCTVTTTTAVNVSEGTYFQTTASKAQYYMAANFTLNNASCYPTALNFNGGNITTYSESGAWIVMSMQNEADKTNYTDTIYFTNDIEAKYINITGNFANFSIVNNETYLISYQANGSVYQASTATAGEIKFSAIPAGSWYISAPYGTGVYGFVCSYPSYKPANNATVNIWNATGWSNSTTTSADGFYIFENLTWNYTVITNETFNSTDYGDWIQLNHTEIVSGSQVVTNTTDEIPFYNNTDYLMNCTDGTIQINASGNMTNHTLYHVDYNYTGLTSIYSLNATAPYHRTSVDIDVTVRTGEYTRQDFCDKCNSTYRYFVIYAKDAATKVSIQEFSATWETITHDIVTDELIYGTETVNTTTGKISIVKMAGTEIEISALYYYSDFVYAYYDFSDGSFPVYETTVLLSSILLPPQYPLPHLVDFKVVYWGSGDPVPDVYVTAIGYETTMGSLNWLYQLFGYPKGLSTPIYNETMNGTTGSDGSISFVMVETIRYKMTFTKGSEINETVWVYPKEEHYKIIIGTKWVQTESMWDVVNYSVLINDIPGNDTHSYINFSYVDLNNATSEIYYFINQTNGTTSFNIYNTTYTGGDCANIINSYIVKRGEAFLIGFVGANDDYGVIKYSICVRIFEKAKRLLEFEDVPDYIYTYISIGLLCLVGAFFGMVTVPEGSIVICLEAWILWFLGWFLFGNPLAPLYLTVATVFAVLIIFTAKGRSKGVS